jgi:hypothetical protein
VRTLYPARGAIAKFTFNNNFYLHQIIFKISEAIAMYFRTGTSGNLFQAFFSAAVNNTGFVEQSS